MRSPSGTPTIGNVRGSPDWAPIAVSSTMGSPVSAEVTERRPRLRRNTGPSRWCSTRASNHAIGRVPASSRILRGTALVWSKRKSRPMSSTIGGAYQRSRALTGYVRPHPLGGPPRLTRQRGTPGDLRHQLADGLRTNRPAARSLARRSPTNTWAPQSAPVTVRLTGIAVMMKDLQNPPHGLVSYDLLLGFEVGPSDLHPV
jgi:hypothetical protein